MNDETLIKVEGVSKKFCRNLKKSLWYGIKDLGNEILGRRHGGNGALRLGEFWAVNDVSFELKRGECLGLIGRNGAGKTTLLRMLNGLIKPDSGRIEMRGRVGALIALGAGFNPILTGRENIYVNGSVLGLKKREIDRKIEEIIDFSEIKEFIDTPVQNYSSGMTVRLGFSIASSFTPDILILDEVLAVGDASFRAKCYRRIGECISSSAVIFVSHNMEQIARICNICCVLEKGELKFLGEANKAISLFGSMLQNNGKADDEGLLKIYPPILSVKISPVCCEVKQGDELVITLSVDSLASLQNCWIRVVFFNNCDGYAADIDLKTSLLDIKAGHSNIKVSVKDVRLRLGRYRLGINIFTEKGDILCWSYKQLALDLKNQNHIGNADYQPCGNAKIIHG